MDMMCSPRTDCGVHSLEELNLRIPTDLVPEIGGVREIDYAGLATLNHQAGAGYHAGAGRSEIEVAGIQCVVGGRCKKIEETKRTWRQFNQGLAEVAGPVESAVAGCVVYISGSVECRAGAGHPDSPLRP